MHDGGARATQRSWTVYLQTGGEREKHNLGLSARKRLNTGGEGKNKTFTPLWVRHTRVRVTRLRTLYGRCLVPIRGWESGAKHPSGRNTSYFYRKNIKYSFFLGCCGATWFPSFSLFFRFQHQGSDVLTVSLMSGGESEKQWAISGVLIVQNQLELKPFPIFSIDMYAKVLLSL